MMRLGVLRAAARLALLWEVLARALWPVLTVAGVMASLVLLGAASVVPPFLLPALLLGACGGLVWLGRRAWPASAWPDRVAAERRLERDSGLAHRPFATLRDRPATEGAAVWMWQAHRARAEVALGRLRLRAPDAALAVHDPRALRAGAMLLLGASLVVAGPQAGTRFAALVPSWPGSLLPPAPAIQAWIQPPAYTGLPPVFLPQGGGAVTVPAGSRLNVSITGAGAVPQVSVAGVALPVERLAQESFQGSGVVSQPGEVVISGRFSRLAGWDVKLLGNEAPRARWSRLPGRAGTSLATSLPWEAAQRWGVAALEARMRPRGRDDLPELRIPLPLPGTPKQASGEAKPDLSANPLAGVTMTARLHARDVSGQEADAAPAEFVLPARVFHHPLARAIIDLRQRLALHPEQASGAAAELAALGEAPVTPPVAGLSAAGTMLNLAAAAAAIGAHPAEAAMGLVQARLWTLALALDGALPDTATAALDQAREALRRGLDDHAKGKMSDAELHQKLQALKDALGKRMDALARQAMKQGALQNFDPKTQHLSSSAMDRAIEKLERALKDGRMEDARQAMAQLNRMMDQLKNAHVMTPQEAQQRQEQAKQARQQTGAVQDMVQRETGLLDHAQQRAPLQGGPVPPQAGEVGRQDLSPPTGTEDPSAAPNELPSVGGGSPPKQDPRVGQAQAQERDARTQRALHRSLDVLQQGLAQSGQKPNKGFAEAGRAMGDAARALSGHDDPTSRDAVSRAIAALQQGGQQMSREQQGEGGSESMQLSLQPGGQGEGQGTEEGEDGEGDGHAGTRRDPFGRQVDGSGAVGDDPQLRVPEEMEQGRSRVIQEELRRRGADRARPKSELDYIDRLLKPF